MLCFSCPERQHTYAPHQEKISFGERLRELRTAAGLNSMELADRSGLRLRNLMAMEGGKVRPTFEDACKLADALDVSLDEFRGTRRR